MKTKLLVMLVIVFLALCGVAAAMELPNPEGYLGEAFTESWEEDLGDGYHGWGWGHMLDSDGRDAVIARFIDDCVTIGYTYQETTSDESGAPAVFFEDNDGRQFALQVTDEFIYLFAPNGTTLIDSAPADADKDNILGRLISGRGSASPAPGETAALPVFNTPVPTAEPLTMNYLEGVINGEPITLLCTEEGGSIIQRRYVVTYVDFEGRMPIECVQITMPGSIREGNVYRLDKNNRVVNLGLLCWPDSSGYYSLVDVKYSTYTKGDFIEVAIDSISSDGKTVKGRLSFQCGAGTYVFKDGVFAFTDPS